MTIKKCLTLIVFLSISSSGFAAAVAHTSAKIVAQGRCNINEDIQGAIGAKGSPFACHTRALNEKKFPRHNPIVEFIPVVSPLQGSLPAFFVLLRNTKYVTVEKGMRVPSNLTKQPVVGYHFPSQANGMTPTLAVGSPTHDEHNFLGKTEPIELPIDAPEALFPLGQDCSLQLKVANHNHTTGSAEFLWEVTKNLKHRVEDCPEATIDRSKKAPSVSSAPQALANATEETKTPL